MGRLMVPASRQLAFDDGRDRRRRTLDVVVSHHVPEAMRLLELTAGEQDPLADLAGALGRSLAQAPLELGNVGGDEDRHAAGHLVLHSERSLELELEHADPAVVRDSIHLRAKRPVAVTGYVRNPLEELARADPPRELLVGEKQVLAAVELPRTLRPGRRRHRDVDAGYRLSRPLISVPFPAPDGPVITKTGRRRHRCVSCGG